MTNGDNSVDPNNNNSIVSGCHNDNQNNKHPTYAHNCIWGLVFGTQPPAIRVMVMMIGCHHSSYHLVPWLGEQRRGAQHDTRVNTTQKQ